MKRTLIMTIALLAALLASNAAQAQEPTPVRRFLDTYCIRCHGKEKQKGHRRFDTLRLDPSDARTGESLQEILDQLNLGDMPPEESDQPTDAELDKVVEWLTSALASARQAAQKHKGHVVMRRLNTLEYRNTLSDLFDLDLGDFDVTMAFPEDERAHGFDNIGDALVMSGPRVEQLAAAAEKVAARIMKPGPQPKVQEIVTEPSRKGRQILGPRLLQRFLIDRDTYLVRNAGGKPWSAPHDGDYEFQITAAMMRRLKSRFDNDHLRYYKWKEPARLRVAASASTDPPYYKVIGEVEIPDTDPEMRTLRTFLRKGARVSITWPNGLHSSHKKILRKVLPKYTKDALYPERNPMQMYLGSGPELHLHRVSVKGPLYDQWPPAGFARYFGDVPAKPTEADLVRSLNRLADAAFRRPVKTNPSDRDPAHLRVAKAHLKESRNFWASAQLGVRAILCSPRFLYLVESKPGPDRRVDPYELASRLSYFLWRSMPDAELLEAAGSGKLLNPETLRAQADRLLKDPRSARFVEDFTDHWLWLDQLGSMPPDPQVDKAYYEKSLEPAMRGETLAFFANLLRTNGSVLDFLDSDYTFVNAALAEFYGLKDRPDSDAFVRVSLPADARRGGLLGQAGILTVTANGVETQPVRRGVWILENLLGTPPPPPPPDVPEIAPDTRKAKTVRQLMELHRANRSCNRCHRKIDPLGLSLEHFDYLGRFRSDYGKAFAKEHGREAARINVDAELWDGTKFQGAEGLRKVLLARPDPFRRCLVEKLMVFSLGRELDFTDRDDVERIVDAKITGLRDLILAVILGEPFGSK